MILDYSANTYTTSSLWAGASLPRDGSNLAMHGRLRECLTISSFLTIVSGRRKDYNREESSSYPSTVSWDTLPAGTLLSLHF